MLRYAITNARSYAGNPAQRLETLVQQTAQWAAAGIDFIQVREKDLPAGALANLTHRIIAAIAQAKANTKVLVNSRADVAIAAGASGVHLTASPGEPTPSQVRHIFRQANRPAPFLSISCHTLAEVAQASKSGVDAILFGPVFGKSQDGAEVVPGIGLELLSEASTLAGATHVFALGGITQESIPACLHAGAAGIAAIRLFQNLPHE